MNNKDALINYIENNPIVNEIEQQILNIQDITKKQNKSHSFFLYGPSASGKTTIINHILNKNKIDHIYFDINNIKDRNNFNEIIEEYTSSTNILDCFNGIKKDIYYIVDNIDHIHNNEKIFIGNIIKKIRPKKKGKKCDKTLNYEFFKKKIIFIGSNDYEKKIKELMKICQVYNLYERNFDKYYNTYLNTLIKKDIFDYFNLNNDKINEFLNFSNDNLKKILYLKRILNNCDEENVGKLIKLFYQFPQYCKYNENIIHIICSLFFDNNNIFIQDNDKTTTALLFHENVIDFMNNKDHFNYYIFFLKNLCIGDYFDRICFQKQIWLFNEMTYFLKIEKNYKQINNIIDETKNDKSYLNYKKNIRFTKILTKYSTEYNNNNFINSLCNKLNIDKKELFYLFDKNFMNEDFYKDLENYEITKLEIKRLNTFLGLL